MQRLYAYLLVLRYFEFISKTSGNLTSKTDAKGRLLTVKDSRGDTMAIAYQYDLMGNKISMTIDGKTIAYAYDTTNKLIQIKAPSPLAGERRGEEQGERLAAQIFTFAYDKTGRRTNLTFPNGTTANYTYDNIGRLTNLIHKTTNQEIIESFAYTMDKVGNRLSKTETDTKTQYAYDAIYRLTQAVPTKLTYKSKGEGEERDRERDKERNNEKEKHKEHDSEHDNKAEYFTYDQVGNRLSGPNTRDFYSYNQLNQLTEDRKHSYEYDKNGNLIRKIEKDEDGKIETYIYSYDYENRLIKVAEQKEDETKTVSFKYDPFGRRIQKRVDKTEGGRIEESKIYDYVYDNEDIIMEYLTKAEDGQSKTEKTRYVHGPGIDEPLAIERKGE